MLAEIHNKTVDEDVLTGNFFGALRYISFNRGLKRILMEAIYPNCLSEEFAQIEAEEWSENIFFWKREREVEPDVWLEFDKAVIAVEVKLHSGLSSDDDVDNSTVSENHEREKSDQQLAREGEMLERIACRKTKILVLWAKENSCFKIYENTINRNIIPTDILFGYITWQKALDVLETMSKTAHIFEKVIIEDLITLLKKKGFEHFKSFEIEGEGIDVSLFWNFDDETLNSFSFIFDDIIKRGSFYEFG